MAAKRKAGDLERTLYFSRLSPQATTCLLALKFQSCPGFVDAATSGNRNGTGFVDFDSNANALLALSKFDGTMFVDAELRISLQPPPGGMVPDPEPPANRSLFVYGFLPSMTRRKLRDKFEEFGTISDINIPVDRLGVSKNFAFVRFTDLKSATQARLKLHRTFWDGRYLVVRYKSLVNEDGSDTQEHTTPLALELPSPETLSAPKKMREIKADSLDEKVVPKVVYERTSEDFMTLSNQELVRGMETYGEPMRRGIQELREYAKNMFPDKLPAQQTRRIVSFQFGWIDRHLMDIKNLRVPFSTKEDLTPRLDDSLEKRQRRVLLLFAMSRIRLIVEQMFILNHFFPSAFPRWPDSLHPAYEALREIIDDVIPAFETTFNSSLDVERLGKFIHEDVNTVFGAISQLKWSW